MPRPKTEAELSRFIRDPDSAADPETVRKAEERLASLERELLRQSRERRLS